MFSNNVYSLNIFNGFDKEVVDKIVENCETRNYFAGDVILVQGEPSNGEGYIIKDGKVLVTISGDTVTELYSGDIFGEIALLNEEERTATISAITNVKVLVLSMEKLIELINNDENSLNKKILKRIEENIERK